MSGGYTWTPERKDLVAKYWTEGLSASVIAERMPVSNGIRPTRSSVCGLVSRMGLAKRRTTNGRGKAGAHKPVAKNSPALKGNPAFRALSAPAAVTYVEAVEEVVIPLAERKTLQDLEDKDCRWPIGDPRKPDFHFCARPKVPGLSYCDNHARRAYRVPAVTGKASNTTSGGHADVTAPIAGQNSRTPATSETEGV